MSGDKRVYHGMEDRQGNAWIYVEPDVVGPRPQRDVTPLYTLVSPDGPIWWGYVGDSPRRTAVLVLEDALGYGPGGLIASAGDDEFWHYVLSSLVHSFCADIVAYFCSEWRLSRGAVLRWTRGYYEQHRLLHIAPDAVQALPTIKDDGFPLSDPTSSDRPRG